MYEALIGILVGYLHAKFLDNWIMRDEIDGYSPLKSPWSDKGFFFSNGRSSDGSSGNALSKNSLDEESYAFDSANLNKFTYTF